MLYANKIIDFLKNLNELVSSENQVPAVRLQVKLGKQNFHEDKKKVFEPVTKPNKDISENVIKNMMITSKENNLAVDTLNNKLSEKMNARGILASYLLSLLSKITNPGKTTQFKLVEDAKLNRVNDLKSNKLVPITLKDNLLSFRDTGKELKLKGDLLTMITNKNHKVDHASLSDKKVMYDFAKEKNFDLKALGMKFTRDCTLIKLLKPPGSMFSASSVTKTIFLSSLPDEFFVAVKLLLQEKQAGNKSKISNNEIAAIVDKLLECKCMSKKTKTKFN